MRTYIKLVTKQIYNFGIVNYNAWCTYSPLVPKRDTFLPASEQVCLLSLAVESLSMRYCTVIRNEVGFFGSMVRLSHAMIV